MTRADFIAKEIADIKRLEEKGRLSETQKEVLYRLENDYVCSNERCFGLISPKVYEFSIDIYGKPLCYKCQYEFKGDQSSKWGEPAS